LLSLALTGCLLFPEQQPRPGEDVPFSVGGVRFPDDSATSRGLMTHAANGRVSAFIEKCRAGKSVSLGFVGGSITLGPLLKNQSDRFSDRLADFLRADYPGLKVEAANISISSTGSRYGASRVRPQLFGKAPDLIVVEFAVNDYISGTDTEIKASLEGLVRQCLKLDSSVAVILLFMPKGDGNNVQGVHAEVGAWYDLPMISYRDAIWPFLASGRIAWKDVFIDDPHLTTAGHRIVAQLLHTYLKRAAALKGGSGVAVPAPLVTDLFERAGVVSPQDSAVMVSGNSWTRTFQEATAYHPARYAYRSNGAGPDTLTLKTRSREVALGLHMQPSDTSSIRVYVDGVLTIIENNAYAFDYTRVLRLPIAPTTAPRTFQVIHAGNPITLDYILYAGTPD
jgi:lysophospholipase L1-like esterase